MAGKSPFLPFFIFINTILKQSYLNLFTPYKDSPHINLYTQVLFSK